MTTTHELLRLVVERQGSDLHLREGSPPRIRVNGELTPVGHEALTAEASKALVHSIMTEDQITRLERDLELDFSFVLPELGRFRTNAFYERGAVSAAIRHIPSEPWPLGRIGLNVALVRQLCAETKGLILVTGAAGTGKSTTLAAMIDHLNRTRRAHIVTIEDPVEFEHRSRLCLVTQRQVGTDAHTFHAALRAVLRQDPDVVLIGEMRDPESIEVALTLAETGHLTFATLHTSDCVQTVNRIVDVFPPQQQQQQIRTQLSFTIKAVIAQVLLPRQDGQGRILASEMMIANPAIRGMIRDNKMHQVQSILQTGAKEGMHTLNQNLCDLVRQGRIALDVAMGASPDPDDLQSLLRS